MLLRIGAILLGLAVAGCSGSQSASTVSTSGALASASAMIASSVNSSSGALSLSAVTYSVSQSAGFITMTVYRTGGSTGAVTVGYATANNTATAGTDFTSASGTLTWASGDTAPKTFTIPIINSKPFAGTKNFAVALSPMTGAALGPAATAAVVIVGDSGGGAPGQGSVALSAANYTVAQSAGYLTVSVSRFGGSSGAVSVAYATAGGTAVPGSDFTAASGTLNWASGDVTPKPITIPISNANPFTGTKTFAIALSGASGASLANPASALVTINGDANSPGILALSAAGYAVAQNAGSVTVSVARTGGTTGAVSVSYMTVGGSAVPGTDFTAASGTLKWASGDATAKTISIKISNATPFLGTKVFTVALAGATAASLGAPATAAVTINGDAYAPGKLALGAASYTVAQNAGSVTVTVTRSGGASGAATVFYQTQEGTTQTPGLYYTPASGTLYWPSGASGSKTITIQISNASPFFGTKNFQIELSNATGAALGTPAAALVTILGDAPAGTIALSSALYTVAQNAGSVTVSVIRTGGSSGPVSITYATADASARAGIDYTAASGVLTWKNGDHATKTFAVPISDATPFAGTRGFRVAIAPVNGANLGTPSTAAVIIDGDTASSGQIALSAAGYTVAQNAGSVTVSVARTGGSNGVASVTYATADGTAKSGTDYSAESGTLSWAAGDASVKTFAVPVSNATPFAGTKAFSVSISHATGASLGSPAGAAVTIDGDAPTAGKLALSAASYSVAQNAGSLTVSVTRTGGSNGAASVAYATANGTAKSGIDYTAASGTLTWASGDASAKTFAVAISNGTPFTGTKTFAIAISGATGASLGAPSAATATINGSVVPAGQVVIDASSNLATISANQLGTNLSAWADITQAGYTQAIAAIGAHLIRWPGGSNSDAYHWKTQTTCSQDGAYMNPNSTFDHFMQDVVIPGGFEVAVTANYGTNSSCNGGGSPSEAAAWVAYAKSKGYNVHHWTVGNEVYGDWELDMHAKKNDAKTYAAAVAGSTGYYQLMKNADPTAQVGVVVDGGSGWDSIVLAQAPFDFIEYHAYAQQPGSESDSYLLTQYPADFTKQINTLRSELAAAGKPTTTPILIGEFNSVAYNPGKQTMSIVNALYLGMTFGEILNDGVNMATPWFGHGGSCNNGNNNSSNLYGWQNFGAYDQISVKWTGCGGSVTIPAGVELPNGYAEYLVSQFAVPGGTMLSATVGSGLPNVRAYAASTGSGYSVMLFNLSQTTSSNVTVSIANSSGGSYNATTITYGKAQYDNSANNVWTGPAAKSIGTANGNTLVNLPPYSMTVLKLN